LLTGKEKRGRKIPGAKGRTRYALMRIGGHKEVAGMPWGTGSNWERTAIFLTILPSGTAICDVGNPFRREAERLDP
jgi:hypothetical protein